MAKEICISTTPHETRLAIVEDDQLTEIYYERENEYTLAGSIYKGRVTRVLPGMQSAFVDVGLERDAFLYVTDFLEEQEDSADFEQVKQNSGARAEGGERRRDGRGETRPETRTETRTETRQPQEQAQSQDGRRPRDSREARPRPRLRSRKSSSRVPAAGVGAAAVDAVCARARPHRSRAAGRKRQRTTLRKSRRRSRSRKPPIS
jgi:Ribonuclease G/E